MKKLLFLVAVMVGASLASCSCEGQKSNSEAEVPAEVEIVEEVEVAPIEADSVAVDSLQIAAPADSIAAL